MKTFSILIATVGRPALQNMLDSFSPQLKFDDCLTIVFDGHSAIPSEFDLSKFKCKVNRHCEPTALGYWGHGIRNKYASIIEKRDFIMHADDDDTYVPNAFKIIRHTCTDKNTLYVFKMALSPTLNFPQTHEIRENNIGTPLGVIPYELNMKGSWLCRFGGDGAFYEEIAKQAEKIVFSNFVIFNIRPHLWKVPDSKNANQLKFIGGKFCLL